MNILITGGAGYIGTELTIGLSKLAHVDSILVYDNLSRGNYNLFLGEPKLPSKVSFRRAELLDTRQLKDALAGIDVVYHLAANITTPFAQQNPHFLEQINHWGTAELVYAIEQSDVKKLIYVSSTSVYGASMEHVDAQSKLEPTTHYGISKMRGEQHVARIQRAGFPAWIIRCGNVFGFSKSMRFDSVINRFIFEANFYRKINIHGKGAQHRSFIQIDRACNVLANLIQADLQPDVYNLVEKTMNIAAIADELKRIYPDLEMIYMDQMMNLRELRVNADARIDQIASLPEMEFGEQLVQFKNSLTF